MKLFINILLLAVFAAFSVAVAPQKPVVVSYPHDTPDSVLEKAMEAIKKAGGVITHEYNVIKGFAAMASEQALDSVQAMGETNNVLIEEDQVVSINGNDQ